MTGRARDLDELARRLCGEMGFVVGVGRASVVAATDEELARTVVVFPDLPHPLTAADRGALARAHRSCPFVVVEARDAARDPDGSWTSDALAGALEESGADAGLFGHAADDEGRPTVLVAIVGQHAAVPTPGSDLRVAALIHVRNGAEALAEALGALRWNGAEVHVFDGWSTDGTWDLLEAAQRDGTVQALHRFPADGPDDSTDPDGQLRATEAYARQVEADWVVSAGAGEVLCSPWPGARLVDALAHMDRLGYNAASHTAHQVSAWKNAGPVDLATSEGWSAAFPGRRTFPLQLQVQRHELRGVASEPCAAPRAADGMSRRDEGGPGDELLVERLVGIGPAEGAATTSGDGVTYLDGAEDALLQVFERAGDVSWGSDELMAHIVDWPTRYHLSPLRAHLLKPLVLRPGTRVLDVGAGTGALARWLGEQGCEVTALEGSAARARVAAERCRDLDHVRVVTGTIDDLAPDDEFDLVCIIGVLEYTPAAIGGGGGPQALLRGARARLADGGALALAIENQLGLKYLMGGAEDHHGLPWVGLEDYPGPPGPRTWTRRELGRMLSDAGLPHQTWLAAYPDYKLPAALVHEQAFSLPDADELLSQLVLRPVSFADNPPSRTGDAAAAHRVLLRAGLGLELASSHLVVAQPSAGPSWVDDGVLAWMSSGHRTSAFRRDRVLTTDRRLRVTSDRRPRRVGWLEQVPGDDRLFVAGPTLGEQLDAALRARDVDGVVAILRRWDAHLDAIAHTAERDAPGPYGCQAGQRALPPDHLDAIPANFVVTDAGLVLIDDEWRVEPGVDFDLVRLRGLWTIAHTIVTSGIAHPWDEEDTVDQVFRRLLAHLGELPPAELVERFRDADVELQALVAAVPEPYVRGDWLNPDRRGLDNRPDEELRREVVRLREERAILEASDREMRGQRDHLSGLLDAARRDLDRMQTVRGWATLRAARSRLGRRLRRR